MIYTSYFAKMRKLPEDIVAVAICGGVPSWYKGLVYRYLNPEYNSFKQYKEDGNEEVFSEKYKSLVLERLNVSETVQNLYKLSGGYDVCLLCYEKSDSFCHRHLVRDWLVENGYECEELNI